MTYFPGLGRRIADRLQVVGFSKDGRPDVGRFCREKGYRPQYVYAWLKDRMPAYENLRRLAADLDVEVVWLLTGNNSPDPPAATADASAAARRSRRTPRPPHRVPPRTGLALDVVPLREATDKIMALQAELEALFTALPDPCAWLDERGRVLAVNGPPGSLSSDLVGQTLRDAFAPEAALSLHRALSQVVSTGRPTTVEYEVIESGGSRRTYEARLMPVQRAARPRKALLVVRDVTERALREHHYRELVDGAANGLCIHRDYVIRFANKAMAKMFGYPSPSGLVGRDIRELLPDHRADPTAGLQRRLVASGVNRFDEPLTVVGTMNRVTWEFSPAVLLTFVAATPGTSPEPSPWST